MQNGPKKCCSLISFLLCFRYNFLRVLISKNVNIKISSHDAFLDKPSSGALKVEKLENQIILNVLGESKPKSLNRIAKISYDHLLFEGGEP
jgi:hypothetical protein